MFLGIEIGGTKLQLGIGPGDGTLLAFKRLPVELAAGGEGIRQRILEAVPELLRDAGLAKCHIHGLGIGFGGPVDDATRRVLKSHQVEGWADFPLADWAEEQLGWRTELGNDADVAGLAEALFGAGKGLSPIFYITIGSGIGGGLIINGEIYRGCGKGAAEIGHLRVSRPTMFRPDKADSFVLEDIASGWGIAEWARLVLIQGRHTDVRLGRAIRGDPRKITAKLLGQLAAEGDEFSQGLLREPLWYLAYGISHVIALVSPRRIIIGGGVSLMGEKVLFEPLRQLVAERVFKPFADCYDIVPAALGEEVVVHGALALARKQLASR